MTMNKKDKDNDLSLKVKMHELLNGLEYDCKVKYDDAKRILKDEVSKKDLLELDGAYYDIPSQCMIYLEATTQSQSLTQKVSDKHKKIILYRDKIEKMLGVHGKVEKMRLLFVSDRRPEGKDLEGLHSDLEVIFITTNELDNYYNYLFHKIGKYLRPEFNALLKIDQEDNSIIVPAIKINMSGSTIYLFELSVDKILKTCYAVRKKEMLGGGYQRIIDDKKLKDIGEFLKSGKSSSIFPNSILVNLDNKVKEVKTISNNIVELSYPMTSGAYHIIDGQHRVYGYCKTDIRLEQARLIVVGLKSSSPEDEIRFFLKINKTQKKIDPTLLSILLAQSSFSEDEGEFWDSRAAKLVLELDKEGIYKNRIYKGAYLEDKKTEQKATLSYMAERIEKTKLLAYKTKKNKSGTMINDGLLQTKEQIKDLSIPHNKIKESIAEIVRVSEQCPEIIAFFSTNRGFDLLCRLIKAYFELKEGSKKFDLDMKSYFGKVNITKDLVLKFKKLYGSGGMAQISKIVQTHLRKDSSLKKIRLTS